jgi:uncharacterized protein YeaO (DUF488 family)
LHVVYVWRTVSSPHFGHVIRSRLEDAVREALEEQVRWIEGAGGPSAERTAGKGPRPRRTEMEQSGRQWHGETGYTTEAMLAKYVGDLTLPFYYVGGPPAMVSAMRETLGEAGVNDGNIRSEEFSGYSEAEQGWDMNIKVKRVYEQPDKEDGRRILVDRIWPRGISKDKARLSDWRRDLAPSNELRRWFGHEPDRWEEFKERYRAELEEAGKTGDLRDIAQRAREENVTLLFGAKDTKHNNARALEAFVGKV